MEKLWPKRRRHMQAFYFHLRAGDYRILDEEGEELPDALVTMQSRSYAS